MSHLLLKDALAVFYGSISNTKTRTSYRETLDKMADYIGNRPVSSVSSVDLIAHLNTYIARKLSPHTVNKHIKTVRVFFNWLVRAGEITHSPASALKRQRANNAVPRDKAMPPEDFAKLLEYTRWFPREDAIAKFLRDTACRARGVAGLRIADIDFSTNTATVTEKGDIARLVAFGDVTATALKRWLKVRQAPSDFVFQSGTRAFTAEAAGQLIRRLCIKVGVKPRQTHSLRHAKAHELTDAGVGVTVIAKALGNSEQIIIEYYMPKDIDRGLIALKNFALSQTEPEPQPDNIVTLDFSKRIAK